MAITPRQRKFINLYLATGDAVKSYIEVGFKCDEVSAVKKAEALLSRPAIKEIIENKDSGVTILELKQFWTELMRDKEANIKDRIRASELLAKMFSPAEDENEININLGETLKEWSE